jgi:hypothetical protein
MGFDSRFRIVEQQIEGGEFLTAEAYAAVIATSPSQSSPDAQ